MAHIEPSIPGRERQRVGEPHADGTVAFHVPEYHFCPRCGTRLVPRPEHEAEGGAIRPTCPKCGFVAYYNPVPAVGAVILLDGQVLLVRRAYAPKKDQWSLPAGFMEYGERQMDALAREVREETALVIHSGYLLSVEDASDDPRAHALLIAFLVDDWEGAPRPGDDASEVRWWPLDRPPADMAWRNHARVLARTREVLGG